MSEENKIGYYAVIPATILFNKDLKANEKLLYAIITILSNKEGYCFASNAYLSNLLDAQPHTISKWVSHLRECGFVCLDMIKNEKGKIIQRRIYPNDTPYTINRTYPYSINGTEGMSQKGQYNIISINKIDRFFNYIINNKEEFPAEFSKVDFNEIYNLLKKYDMLYTKDSLQYITGDNLERIKVIDYAIALMVRDKLQYLTHKVSRDKLLKIYNDCKLKENEYKDLNNPIESFINYYYKSVTNELTKDKQSPSFLVPNIRKLANIGHQKMLSIFEANKFAFKIICYTSLA